MNSDERNLIEGLFQRLRQAEAQSGPRDTEAEKLILGLTAQQPSAPYLLAQVVLVQEQGLQSLQGRVEQLERELAERPQAGGFLGGLFGGRNQAAQPPTPARTPQATGGQWDRGPLSAQGASAMRPGMQPGAQGGGFMAGALQTAMGVAGGVLLGNAIAGLFAGDAQAAEAPVETEAAAPEEPEAGMEEEPGGGFFDSFFGGDDEEGF